MSELQTKLDELKGKSELTEAERQEISSLEKQIEDGNKEVSRYQELSKKDENALTSEEVDELISLSEKFGEEKGEPEGAAPRKYAGIYATLEDLVKGYASSEAERNRIESDPEAIKALEDGYKESQRKVTRLVQERKTVKRPDNFTMKPLSERDFSEMTHAEYDAWEKQDKLSAHAWLSNSVRKESLVQESRMKVLRKYPNFAAEIQGIIEPSRELTEWDRIDRENPELKAFNDWPERVAAKMEENLGIKTITKKPIVLKPDFSQGKGSGAKPSGKKRLSASEFEALTSDEQREYLESQTPQ